MLEVCLGAARRHRRDQHRVSRHARVASITSRLGRPLAKSEPEGGIIKSGTTVVLGKIHPEARAAIEARIQEVGARLIPLGTPEPIPGAPLAYPRIALVGSNLAVAVTIGRELGIPVEALAQGLEQTQWPGRNELLHRNGQELTLLDCAHNPDGAVGLSHALDPSVLGEIESRREIALVFGALATKNWRAMLRRLENVAGHRVFVAPPVPKAADPREMAAFLQDRCRFRGQALDGPVPRRHARRGGRRLHVPGRGGTRLAFEPAVRSTCSSLIDT